MPDKPRRLQRIHIWRPFQAPWEDNLGPGWEQVKIGLPESPPTPKPPPAHAGVDTGVSCFNCHLDTLRVIDHRTEAEVLANLPDEQYRRSRGRGDAKAAPLVLMVICPRCKQRYQLREEVIRRAQR